jgi:Ca-activated chloride channel family protein
LLALACASAAAGSARPQSDDQATPFTLKENVRLVVVPVTAKDRDGRLVQDLTREDFKILEDGKQRPIQYFSNEMAPISALILLDTGMAAKSLATVRSQLRSLSNAFGPSDEVALYFFDKHIHLGQDFTSQADLIVEAVKREEAQGRGEGKAPGMLGGPLAGSPTINGVNLDNPGKGPTLSAPITKSIHDALYEAAQQLRYRAEGRRRVVLILSDGAGGSNTFSYDETLNALEVAKATVYAVSFGSGWVTKRADLLARVARDTGGDIAYVRRQSGLDNACFRLTDESRNSYVLGFTPSAADGKFHDIDVRASRKGLKLIARNRFFAPPLK